MDHLFHGGWHLIYVRETEAVTIEGTITNMDDLGPNEFPEMKTQYGYGKTMGIRFTIDGISCCAPTAEALEIGDDVIVSYLPHSGYVLPIKEIG